MTCAAFPLLLLNTNMTNDSLAEKWLKDHEDAKGEATFGRSLVWRAFPAFQRMKAMHEVLVKRNLTFNRWVQVSTPTMDMVVELFTHNHKIKSPYTRQRAFEFCNIERWYDPACMPGILTFCLLHGREYVMVYGNDQYIQVHPTLEEITKDHHLRADVEKHFMKRGFDFLDDSWAGTD